MRRHSLILALVFVVAACDDPSGPSDELRPTYELAAINGELPAHVWDFDGTAVHAHSGTMEFWTQETEEGDTLRFAELLRITFGDGTDTVTWRHVGTYSLDDGDLFLTPVGGGESERAAVSEAGITLVRHGREYAWH